MLMQMQQQSALPKNSQIAELDRRMAKAARWMDEAESDGVYQAAREVWIDCRNQLEHLRNGR